MKFGIGQPMRRRDDLRLISGRGRYPDYITLPRITHAVALRSPVAHDHIKRIDATVPRCMLGVLFVTTGEDVRADGLGDVPLHGAPQAVMVHRGSIRRGSVKDGSPRR